MNKTIAYINSRAFLWKLLFLLPAVLFTSSFDLSLGEKFLEVKAKSEDSPVTLLTRYQLHTHKCNLEKFLVLNKLKTSSKLTKDKKYKLPLLVVSYNGKSIRSTLGLKESEWSKALRIKKYNDKQFEDKLKSTALTKNNVLWVPYHELNCEGEDMVPVTKPAEKTIASNVAGTRQFPIFGHDHQNVPLRSNKLRGKIYFIVAGHGGPDPGAVGKRGSHTLCEDEYAYDVCLRLTRKLLEHGATPYMIIRDPDDGLRSEEYLKCDTDEYCWGGKSIPRSQKLRLHQRSGTINELYAQNKKAGVAEQYVVTIHVDSRSRGERTDVFFYHHPSSSKGKSMALNLQASLKQNYKKYRAYHGTVTARDLHMLREVKPPSVFIELGNIKHPIDQLRFTKKSNRQYLADWLFEGLVKW